MRPDYQQWLSAQKYDPSTIAAQMHRVGRVEDHYGDLAKHYAEGTLQSVIDDLTYTAEDERRDKPNPSKIPFRGNARNNLASYKNAVARYRTFLSGSFVQSDAEARPQPAAVLPPQDNVEQKLSLERDMQAALRREIRSLEPSFAIIDDGAERSVDSGFIDITCEDATDGSLVVVELKAGKADSRAIGQILGYMGDIAEEEPGRLVKGILVAHDFDQRVVSAAKIVPALKLMRYSIEFRFRQVD